MPFILNLLELWLSFGKNIDRNSGRTNVSCRTRKEWHKIQEKYDLIDRCEELNGI